MFSLHETTQRRVCRVAFVAFCLLPTLWTLGWIAHFYRPWRYDDWQRGLAEHFHVQAKVEGIESPRPGITKLARLQIADLRTQRPLGTIEKLKIENQGNSLALGAVRIEIPVAQVQEFLKTIETCCNASEIPPLKFHAQQLIVVGPQGEIFKFANLRMHGQTSAAGNKQFRLLAEVTRDATPTTVELLVNEQAIESKTELAVQFDTKQSQLPVWMVAKLIPGMSRCTSANFAGKGTTYLSPAGSRGQLQGEVSKINLSQWVGPFSAERVQGMGTLHITDYLWQKNGVAQIKGQLQFGPGRITSDAMNLLVQRMNCQPLPQGANKASEPAEGWYKFDELRCGFEITPHGIKVVGACNTQPDVAGCIMALNGQPLLLQPIRPEISLGGLAQVLLPLPKINSRWMQLSREAIEMMRNLPVPSSVPIPRNAVRKKSGRALR